jgi:hypothetical protein
MTNSKNPNRGHYSPSPTVTYGTKTTTPKPEDRKTTARKGGAS